jgi:hypothetical protein
MDPLADRTRSLDFPEPAEERVRPLIAGKWKMNGLAPQLVDIEAIAASVSRAGRSATVTLSQP